jgi:hypothetical protein
MDEQHALPVEGKPKARAEHLHARADRVLVERVQVAIEVAEGRVGEDG